MTKLEAAAMGQAPMCAADVEITWTNGGPIVRRLCESHERLRMELAGASKLAMRLTDPTPLTEQVLRDAGFVDKSSAGTMFWGPKDTVTVEFWEQGDLKETIIEVLHDETWTFLPYPPRTVGELTQLLDRVNGGGE